MSRGKVNKALRLLSSNSSVGVLSLDDVISDSSHTNLPCTIREILVRNILLESLLQQTFCCRAPHLNLNAEAIRKAALKTNGAAGLSGLVYLEFQKLIAYFSQLDHFLGPCLHFITNILLSVLSGPNGSSQMSLSLHSYVDIRTFKQTLRFVKNCFLTIRWVLITFGW